MSAIGTFSLLLLLLVAAGKGLGVVAGMEMALEAT
jgi:hypothetical protein